MEIAIKDLKHFCEYIFMNMETVGLKEISINHDYYWKVENEKAYDFKPASANTEQSMFSIGSIVWEWDGLKKVLDGKNDTTVTDFDNLGNLVKAVAYSMDQSRPKVLTVAVKDLSALSKIILPELLFCSDCKSNILEKIEIGIDAYWAIKKEDIYDFYDAKQMHEPQLVQKSFVDDWGSLKRMLHNQSQPTSRDVERLGDIIIIIGYSIYKAKLFYS